MKNHFQKRDYKLPTEFEVEGIFYRPTDDDDMQVQIVDAEEMVLFDESFDPNDPDEWLIPGDSLELEPDELAKDVFLTVSFVVGEEPLLYQQHFRIIRQKPITVTPNALRATVGANIDELPSEVLDIYGSYLDISERIGDDLFADPKKVRVANRLIHLYCLLQQLPTLQMRLLHSRAVDDHKFTRDRIDYDKLNDTLMREYETLLAQEFGYSEQVADEPLVTIVSRDDPFGGV